MNLDCILDVFEEAVVIFLDVIMFCGFIGECFYYEMYVEGLGVDMLRRLFFLDGLVIKK